MNDEVHLQLGILTRKPVKTIKKKPILERWSVSLGLIRKYLYFFCKSKKERPLSVTENQIKQVCY